MAKFFNAFLFLFSFTLLQLTAAIAIDENVPEAIDEIEAGDEFQVFQSAYTSIYYAYEADLEAFLWRITGDEDIDAYSYPGIAKERVDRIIEKVESILDMYPDGFRVKIYIHPEHQSGPLAYYSHGKNTITVYLDTITENILAHEISHAIIRSYFKILPPKKIREILSQYVDQYLRSE